MIFPKKIRTYHITFPAGYAQYPSPKSPQQVFDTNKTSLWPKKHSKYLRSTPVRWASYGRSFDTAKFKVAEKFQAQTASARSAAECQVMNRFFRRSALLLFPAVLPVSAWACPQQTVSVADSEPKSPADASHLSALVAGHVFAFPVATKSVDAQKLVETALDQYENVLLENSVENARKATEK
ncbi:MAG: hypothetical protein DMG34_12905, partial [Acidobacteria bacterium]